MLLKEFEHTPALVTNGTKQPSVSKQKHRASQHDYFRTCKFI